METAMKCYCVEDWYQDYRWELHLAGLELPPEDYLAYEQQCAYWRQRMALLRTQELARS
jgi:hypothetical protein